jgi:hypothetical protein
MDRTHNLTIWAVYAISLLLASFLGYTLALAQGAQSAMVIGACVALMLAPLMVRGHQAVLLFSWNSTIAVQLLPVSAPAWLFLSGLTFVILFFQRALVRGSELNLIRSLTVPMLVFSAVVVVTMLARGGLGVQWLGSGAMAGGRKYFYIIGAIIGYFAISFQKIPPERAMTYVGLYFLGGLTGFLGPLGAYLGGPFQYLMMFFNPIEGVSVSEDAFRVKGLSYVGNAIFGFLLARYGFSGVFHTGQVWRPVLLVLGMMIGLLSGYRTLLVLYGGTLAVMFVLEGWHRTKWLYIWLFCGMCFTLGLYQATPHLPKPVQRALAVLPLPVSSSVQMEAEGTLEWRERLWQDLLPDVPSYLWLGKGVAISTREMEWAETLARFSGRPWDYAYITGEHHNGFLSVTIAFGVWGLAALLWLLGAGVWVLWRNWKHGRPELVNVNALLLASFICWILLFFTYWGTLYWSLRDFTGILGLSVALNHGVASVRRHGTGL